MDARSESWSFGEIVLAFAGIGGASENESGFDQRLTNDTPQPNKNKHGRTWR